MKCSMRLLAASMAVVCLASCERKDETRPAESASPAASHGQSGESVDSTAEAPGDASVEPKKQPPVIEGDLETRARIIVDLLPQQGFDVIEAEFDETLVSELPVDELKESWFILGMQVGKFVKQDSIRMENQGESTAVFVTCTFERASLDVKVVFNSAQRVTELRFQPTIKPLDETPPYAAPDKFTEETISVGSAERPLPGTLTMPAGAGPFPSVVLIHGSGAQDRDESMGPNKPFRDLAWGLASRGIAVLRYEKRTMADSAGGGKQKLPPTVKEEVVDDALSAVAFLQGTSRIDKSRVFVLGHDLGAMLLPRITQQAQSASRTVAGLIALAAPGRPIEESLLNEAIYLAQLDNEMSDEEYARIKQLQDAVKKVEALKPDDAASPVGVLGVPNTYWLDMEGYDGPVAARQIAQPWLIVQGGRDYRVTVDDFGRWKSALSDRKDVTFKTYPALNHLLMAGEGPGSPADYETLRHVDEQVIVDIANWITKGRLETK